MHMQSLLEFFDQHSKNPRHSIYHLTFKNLETENICFFFFFFD